MRYLRGYRHVTTTYFINIEIFILSVSGMNRGQGSLEYIIIIAAVLAVAGVVIMMSTGMLSNQKSSAALNACKQAAAQCKVLHYSAPNDPCNICKTSCNDSGQEIFTGAILACADGKTDEIYQRPVDNPYISTTHCADLTPINTCSGTKPKYCNSAAQLVDNCTKCLCPSGMLCASYDPSSPGGGGSAWQEYGVALGSCYFPPCTDVSQANKCVPNQVGKYCKSTNGVLTIVDNCTCGCLDPAQQCDQTTYACYYPPGTLSVELNSIPSTQKVPMNSTFSVSAVVHCNGGPCGSVNATLKYNSTGIAPDVNISRVAGAKPFYISVPTQANPSGGDTSSTPNPYPCGTMSAGGACAAAWSVNATGPINTQYWLDVNASSEQTSTVSQISNNFQVNITGVPKELFYDEFANLNSWTGVAGAVGADAWHVNTTFGYNNSNSAYYHNYSSRGIDYSQSTAGYTNINVSFWEKATITGYLGDASGEHIEIDWYDGTNWNYLYVGGLETKWNYRSYLLPSLANDNPNFKIKIGCRIWNIPAPDLAYCAVDTLRIIGTQIS
jgi:uncharacterized protein (UPF0333 family)